MTMSVEELLESLKSTVNDEQFTEYLAELAKKFNEIISRGVLEKLTVGHFNFDDLYAQTDFLGSLTKNTTVNPKRLIEQQMQFMQDHAKLWQQTTLSLLGGNVDDVIAPGKGDARFNDQEWRTNPIFGYIKQAYLLNAKSLQDMAADMEFKDQRTAQQVKFWVRQFTNALAPTNFVTTNPEVCRAIIESKGENIREGLQNFLHDLKLSPEYALAVAISDSSSFVLGDNIGATTGAVIYQNELMQLIQYSSQTDSVYRIPILLTPAFINKYYILDLSPKNSLVDWLVKQGFTVFVISWVNPDKELADKSFADYMLKGPIVARSVIGDITGEAAVIGIGYCAGGTLLACAQAYLKARGEATFHSTTYLATLLDFSNPGDVSAYISEEFVSAIERDPLRRGVFDGRMAALCFSLLRENNLYWSFFVKNYLLGKDPEPMDLLYWNSDSTNIPMAMAGFYLRSMYLDNSLIKPGAIVLNETPIDLGVIDTPTYFLSTQADHIALWEGTYLGTTVHGGNKRFVLAGSGHIAGVINPPAANKYSYLTNTELPENAQDWLASSIRHEGSWWSDWLAWSIVDAAEKVPSRGLGAADYPILEAAPGSYVTAKI